jgi:Amt family ammonium transporter
MKQDRRHRHDGHERARCGIQKGKTEYYRGVEMSSICCQRWRSRSWCPRSRSEQSSTPRKERCIRAHRRRQIFVYDVENVVRVRTGEEGYDALQDED